MARSISVEVEPLILKYARHYSGYDIATASRKLKITEDSLKKFEEEKSKVSIAAIKKMAEVYRIPVAFFFLTNPPADLVVPKDFRIIYASDEDKLSPEVMLAIRKARYVQSIIQELRDERNEYEFKSVSIGNDTEKVAEYFRSILNVSTEQQKKWGDPSSTLRGWKDAVEKLGIFVLQQSLPEDDISAFCLADDSPYIITLNSAEHENRRIFSLFHEIGHVLLHRSGVCTPNNFSRNSFEYIKVEKFCNAFSAAILVPMSDFLSNETVKRLQRTSFEDWSADDVRSLANLYGVSQEVIYRRFVQVGYLDEKKYERKRMELIKSFVEFKKRPKKNAPIPQYRKIISKNGRAYSTFILEKLHSNHINLADAADYLGTNTQHIQAVEAHI